MVWVKNTYGESGQVFVVELNIINAEHAAVSVGKSHNRIVSALYNNLACTRGQDQKPPTENREHGHITVDLIH